MSDPRREALVRMLADHQAHVLAKRRALREDHPADAGFVKDEEEHCADAHALGVDVALVELDSETLRRIDDAITRVDSGTYGVCIWCEEEISAVRLQAVPFAEYCVDCQAEVERAAAAAATVPR